MMSLITRSGRCEPGQLDALGAVVGQQHVEPLELEVHLEQAQDHRVVLDEQHGGGRHRGEVTGRLLLRPKRIPGVGGRTVDPC